MKTYAEVREVYAGLLEGVFIILLPQSTPLLSPSTSENILRVAFNATLFECYDVTKAPSSGNVTRLKA